MLIRIKHLTRENAAWSLVTHSSPKDLHMNHQRSSTIIQPPQNLQTTSANSLPSSLHHHRRKLPRLNHPRPLSESNHQSQNHLHTNFLSTPLQHAREMARVSHPRASPPRRNIEHPVFQTAVLDLPTVLCYKSAERCSCRRRTAVAVRGFRLCYRGLLCRRRRKEGFLHVVLVLSLRTPVLEICHLGNLIVVLHEYIVEEF